MTDWSSVWPRVRAALDVGAVREALAQELPGAAETAAAQRDAESVSLPDVVDDLVGGFASSLIHGAGSPHERYLEYVMPTPTGAQARRAIPEPKAALLMLLLLLDDDAAHRAAEHFGRWQELLEDGTPDDRTAWAARFLADGWWFADAFGLAAVPAEQSARIRAALLALPPAAPHEDGTDPGTT